MPPSDETLIDVFAALDEAAVARVWVALNHWEWPEDFPAQLKPDWWDGHPLLTPVQVNDRKLGVYVVIAPACEARVSKDALEAAWLGLEKGANP